MWRCPATLARQSQRSCKAPHRPRTPSTRQPTRPLRRSAMVRRRGALARGLTGWAFAGPGTMLVVGLSIFPAVWAFLISRTRWNGIAPPKQLGWTNYQLMADDPELWESVRH